MAGESFHSGQQVLKPLIPPWGFIWPFQRRDVGMAFAPHQACFNYERLSSEWSYTGQFYRECQFQCCEGEGPGTPLLSVGFSSGRFYHLSDYTFAKQRQWKHLASSETSRVLELLAEAVLRRGLVRYRLLC